MRLASCALALAAGLAGAADVHPDERTSVEREPILELVFSSSYNRVVAEDPISLQVINEPVRTLIKMEDLVVARFLVTPIGPCVAQVSMEAEKWNERTPDAWPAQITHGSSLYMSRQIGRHRFEIKVAVHGYGSCSPERGHPTAAQREH